MSATLYAAAIKTPPPSYRTRYEVSWPGEGLLPLEILILPAPGRKPIRRQILSQNPLLRRMGLALTTSVHAPKGHRG